MRWSRTILVGLGLVAILTLAGSATAQEAERVTVELEGHVADVPDELPGVYTVYLVAETAPKSGVCACTETYVDLDTRHRSGIQTVMSPSAYAIDWTQDLEHERTHTKEIELNVGVSDVYRNHSMVTVEVDGDARSDTSFYGDSEVLPLEIGLAIPQHEDAEQEAQAQSETNATSEGSNDGASADVDSSSPANEAPVGEAAIGTGAAGLALLGVVARRRYG